MSIEEPEGRQTDSIFPITYDGWDVGGDWGDIQLYNAEFTEPFGPFSEGDKVGCLCYFPEKNIVQSLDDDGKVIVEVKVKVVPQAQAT